MNSSPCELQRWDVAHPTLHELVDPGSRQTGGARQIRLRVAVHQGACEQVVTFGDELLLLGPKVVDRALELAQLLDDRVAHLRDVLLVAERAVCEDHDVDASLGPVPDDRWVLAERVGGLDVGEAKGPNGVLLGCGAVAHTLTVLTPLRIVKGT